MHWQKTSADIWDTHLLMPVLVLRTFFKFRAPARIMCELLALNHWENTVQVLTLSSKWSSLFAFIVNTCLGC